MNSLLVITTLLALAGSSLSFVSAINREDKDAAVAWFILSLVWTMHFVFAII